MSLQSHLKTARQAFPLLLSVLWLGGIIQGMIVLWNYENTFGPSASCPVQWPLTSRITLSSSHPTLIMLMHPHCPCSRASIAELSDLMTRVQGRLSAYVLFYTPKEFDTAWAETDLWQSARRIPGVTVLHDPDGAEAHRFGVLTSGQTMVYDKAGGLLFSGGITAARGHVGENRGLSEIVSAVKEGHIAIAKTPVYGCSLETPARKITWKS